jgi:hypothetical protein
MDSTGQPPPSPGPQPCAFADAVLAASSIHWFPNKVITKLYRFCDLYGWLVLLIVYLCHSEAADYYCTMILPTGKDFYGL